MNLELINSGFNIRILQQVFQMMFQEIAHPNVSNFSFFLKLNESFPSF